ncbi:MAG TPA: tRNA pseudouridine(13) synthase TruD [Gammaproteobacteria bacterium]|jgi:tRNA pseudouridine13 synthase|nr:tRNA pseudouridine(13) synthase TruD [Gammaproteobacteria bacterium]
MSELPDWSFAYGRPECRARIRSLPEDFRVDEVLGFTADGDGEHLLLQVEKRGANTAWVARELARIAGVRSRDVSYAGRKDRNAVTVQHFSLWLGKQPEPDWAAHAHPEYRVLSSLRHRRKLRLGALKGNRFRLVLRELSVPAAELIKRLELIRAQGVPNYFGSQRFGHGGSNISNAERFFADPRAIRDRDLRSLLLSTARSLIFNAILSERVASGTWNTAIAGEVCMLEGTHSVFRNDEVDAALQARIASGDVHPTGPMWGEGERLVSNEVSALEVRVAQTYPAFTRGLEAARLAAARRALRLPVPDLRWQSENERTLTLEFFLPAGAYATTVLRELVEIENPAGGVNHDVEED